MENASPASFLKKHLLSIIVFAVLTIFFFFYAFLVSRTLIQDGAGNIRTTYTGYGDIPFHLTQVTKFAWGKLNDLIDPTYYGQNLQYPFAINFISGMLLRFTGLFSFSFLFPVYFFIGGSIFLLYLFYKKILGNRALSMLLVLLFFFGAGLGGYAVLQNAFAKHFSPAQFVQDLTERNVSTVVKMDAKYPDQNINFGGLVSSIFIPQRAFFIGFFLVLVLLLLLSFVSSTSKKRYSVLAAFVYGILPICHTHSFIAASILLFSFFVARILEKDYKSAFEFVRIVFAGLIIALPQILYLTIGTGAGSASSGGFLHFRFGWMTEPGIGSAVFSPTASAFGNFFSYLKFLWLNFGILLPSFFLLVPFAFWHWRDVSVEWGEKRKQIAPIAISALLIFISVMTVRFQPWDFDDNKLLIYFQMLALATVFFIGAEFLKDRKRLFVTLVILFSCIVSFSGIIDAIPRAFKPVLDHPVIFDQDAQNVSHFIQSEIPANALILTDDSFLNPVDSLAGRPVYLGYPGWLWSHGINYTEREGKLRAFYKDPLAETKIGDEFAFSYILIDNQAVRELGAEREFFDHHFQKIFQSGQFSLYQK